MRIRTVVISIFLLITSLFVIQAMYSVTAGQDFIQESVGQSSLLLAQDMAKFIEFGISIRIDNLIDYSKTSIVQKAVLKSNQEFGEFEDIQGYITQQDDDWQSVPMETISPFMQSLISNELSENIRKNYVEKINPKTGHSIFAELFLTNEYGANVAQSGKTEDYRQDDEDWWQEAKVKGISVGKTEFDESAKTDVIPIAIKITDEDGKFIGVLKVPLSVRSLIREAELFTQYDVTTQVNIVTENGLLVYSTTPFIFNKDISNQSFFEKLQSGEQRGFFVNDGEFRKELVAYVKPSDLQVIGEQGWIFVIKHRIGDVGIMSGILELQDNMIIFSAIIIVIALGLGIIFSRSISNPITRLTYLAEEIGKENFDVKVNLKGRGEIAQLVKKMKDMGNALKKSKKDKDEFVAMISHELKTPLTPIMIYTSSLKRPKWLGELTQNQAEAVDGINFNTLRLERLIGDLLDAQKLELGKMQFEKKEFEVEELMAMITGNLKTQTEQKGGQLINHTKEKITIKSDSNRLAQVLTNLVNNSIDFIPKNKGKIEINAQKKDGKVIFSVKDNGSGMSSETLKHTFQKFYKADTSITRKHGGTGLGLAICKGIVEGLGGTIRLESELGKGTNVYFTIPSEELQ